MTIADLRRGELDESLDCDVCVVGGGAAGISLTLELARANVDVLLVEAGGLNRSGRSQSLYAGELNDSERHLALDQARYRQLGGTTSLWGGRCLPLDPLDFEPRDWIPHSGWPIEYSELASFYQRAHEYCQCGPFEYFARAALPDAPQELIEGFRDDQLLTDAIERWSPPTHFGKQYRRELATHPKIRVLLNAIATQVRTSPDGQRAVALEIAAFGRRKTAIRARHFVLAGGGLETTRLLLCSDDRHAGGLGARGGWLGKGYMCHIHGSIAKLKFAPGTRVAFGYELDPDGIYCRRRLSVSAAAQRRYRLPNSLLLLDRPLLADPHHGSALFSLTYLLKQLLRRRSEEKLGKGKYALYWAHLRNVLSGSPQAMSALPRLMRQRVLQGRRLPSLLENPTSNEYYLYYQLEQVPSRASYVSLADVRDELGMRRLKMHFAVERSEIEAARRLHELIAERLARSGRGQLQYIEQESSRQEALAASKAVLGHHIGTTRMARNWRDGVVDENCRVHGVDNVFVASSSTFPTSGHANPTLTIVALAVRLAAHLAEQVRARARPDFDANVPLTAERAL